MAANPRPPRRPQGRPVAGSRSPTSRPRKVAGRTPPPPEGGPGADAESTTEDHPDAPEAVDLRKAPPPETEEVAAEEPEDRAELEPDPDADSDADSDDGADAQPDRQPRASRRTLTILVAAIVVLALAVCAEGYYLFGPPSEPPVVSGEKPIVADDLSQSVALETAAESATMIVSRSFETYDEEVEAAASTMTEAFAQEYRTTTGDIQDAFVEAKTEVTVEVVARSVVRASEQQVEALLFLNQFVTKDGGEAVYTPYRALATMVRTDQGWLIDDLDTR